MTLERRRTFVGTIRALKTLVMLAAHKGLSSAVHYSTPKRVVVIRIDVENV